MFTNICHPLVIFNNIFYFLISIEDKIIFVKSDIIVQEYKKILKFIFILDIFRFIIYQLKFQLLIYIKEKYYE